MLDIKYNEGPTPPFTLDPDEDPIPVAIYARVSSDGQDINNSVQKQIAECEKYAKAHNMVVVAIYVDEAMTGKTDRRPKFQEMVSDTAAKDKPFTLILVWKFSRFARRRLDSEIYKTRLKKRGVRIISIQEPLEDTPAGRLLEHVLEDVDEFYSDNLSEEVIYGQRKVAERGYWPGRSAPYGYKLKKVREEGGDAYHNIFVKDPPRDAIVRRIILEAIAGRSYNDIRRGLDQDGIPPPESSPMSRTKSVKWANNTIGDIIHERKYTGLIIWGVNSNSGLPPVVAPGRHEPIVSPEELELAGKVVASKTPEANHPRHTGSVYMMSGLLWCKKSNDKLVVRPSKNQTSRYYQCKTRRDDGVEACDYPNLNVKALEQKFMRVLLDDILCPSNVQVAISTMAQELTGPYEEKHARLQAIEEKLSAVTQRKDRVMEAYEGGEYDLEEYSRRISPLRKDEADLRMHLADASRETDHQTAVLPNPQDILAFTGLVADFIRNSCPKERKQMVHRFVQHIWIEPGKATVVYRIPLPKDARRPAAKELVLDLDDPVPPIARLTPHARG